jgi:manganese transport protein
LEPPDWIAQAPDDAWRARSRRRSIPDHRRSIANSPGGANVAAGMDITRARVLSQVLLSLVLPIPMVALVRFTASRKVMGEFAHSRPINALAIAATGFVCLLDGILVLATSGLPIPFVGAAGEDR